MATSEQEQSGKQALVIADSGALYNSISGALEECGADVRRSGTTLTEPGAETPDILVIVSPGSGNQGDPLEGQGAWLERVLAGMSGRGSGRVILVGRVGSNGLSARLQLARLRALTHHHARECGPHGVTINLLELGLLEGNDDPDADELLRRTPLGRAVSTREVAAAVVFLASPSASYLTGASLPVTGGLGLGLFPEQLR